MPKKYQLKVEVKGLSELEQELIERDFPSVVEHEFPYITIMDMDHGGRLIAQKKLQSYGGTETFQLPEGNYRIIAGGLTEREFRNLYLDKNTEITLQTKFRKELEDIGKIL